VVSALGDACSVQVVRRPYQPKADMNDDQVVNGLDVDPFVAAVVGGGAQTASPFVAAVLGSETQLIPEPSTLLLCILALSMVGGWRKWGM
jgi:hypothetical protein